MDDIVPQEFSSVDSKWSDDYGEDTTEQQNQKKEEEEASVPTCNKCGLKETDKIEIVYFEKNGEYGLFSPLCKKCYARSVGNIIEENSSLKNGESFKNKCLECKSDTMIYLWSKGSYFSLYCLSCAFKRNRKEKVMKHIIPKCYYCKRSNDRAVFFKKIHKSCFALRCVSCAPLMETHDWGTEEKEKSKVKKERKKKTPKNVTNMYTLLASEQ